MTIKISTIVAGDLIRVSGENEWGTVKSRGPKLMQVTYGSVDYQVPYSDVDEHRPNPFMSSTPSAAPPKVQPWGISYSAIGKFAEDSKGKVLFVDKFGTKKAHCTDAQGRKWAYSPLTLRLSSKSFLLPKAGATVMIGAVVTCPSAAAKMGYSAKTQFVVIAVRAATFNVVKLGGDPSPRFSYYRLSQSAGNYKVVTL